jgi:hypothetical protein
MAAEDLHSSPTGAAPTNLPKWGRRVASPKHRWRMSASGSTPPTSCRAIKSSAVSGIPLVSGRATNCVPSFRWIKLMQWVRKLPMLMFGRPKGVMGRLGGVIMAREPGRRSASHRSARRSAGRQDPRGGFRSRSRRSTAVASHAHRMGRGRRSVAGNGRAGGGPQRRRVARPLVASWQPPQGFGEADH